jgi:hypothetical protein
MDTQKLILVLICEDVTAVLLTDFMIRMIVAMKPGTDGDSNYEHSTKVVDDVLPFCR